MTFPFRGLDENDTFHLGNFDAARGNFAATSGRGSPFHSLGNLELLWNETRDPSLPLPNRRLRTSDSGGQQFGRRNVSVGREARLVQGPKRQLVLVHRVGR